MNWWNFSSRTDVHENALKRSLFVNYSSTDFVAVTYFLTKFHRLRYELSYDENYPPRFRLPTHAFSGVCSG
jgi:hypothetical protein